MENSPSHIQDKVVKFFVGNIDYRETVHSLWKFFDSEFGNVVKHVYIPKWANAPHLGKSRGFAFVTFKRVDGIQKLLRITYGDSSDPIILHGRTLVIKLAKTFSKSHKSLKDVNKCKNINVIGLSKETYSEDRVLDSTSENFNPDHKSSLFGNEFSSIESDSWHFPDLVILRIFSYLNIEDLHRVMRVSSKWQSLVLVHLKMRKSLSVRNKLKRFEFATKSGPFSTVNNAVLRLILSRCSQITSLDLHNACQFLSQDFTAIIGKYCHRNLRKLDLSCSTINNKSLVILGNEIKNLTHICLDDCLAIGEKGMRAILKANQYLQTVSLNKLIGLTGRCFILAGNKIEFLSLIGCVKLNTNFVMQQTTSKFKNISTLNISECPPIKLEILEQFCNKANSLKCFYIDGKNVLPHASDISLDIALHISSCQTLTTLSFKNSLISPPMTEFIQVLGNCRKLNNLDISACWNFKLTDLVKKDSHIFETMKELRVLKIGYNMTLTAAVLKEISHLPSLIDLDISGCSAITNKNFVDFVPLYLDDLSSLSCGKCINISGCAQIDLFMCTLLLTELRKVLFVESTQSGNNVPLKLKIISTVGDDESLRDHDKVNIKKLRSFGIEVDICGFYDYNLMPPNDDIDYDDDYDEEDYYPLNDFDPFNDYDLPDEDEEIWFFAC